MSARVPSVAIVAAGEMGAAIGGRLVAHGVAVRTSVTGRSPATAERAQAAGMTLAASDAELVDVDIVLSVVPPGTAVTLASRLRPVLAAAVRKPVYVDCNAIAPRTARAIGAVLDGCGAAYVDGGIIGGPPSRNGTDGARIYVTGPAAATVTALAAYGLAVVELAGPIGAASALKLAYAGVTKGLTAIGAATREAAALHGVADALRAEVLDSQPELTAWLDRQIPRMPPKAYRWVAEMDEIATFLDDPGHGAELYSGAARFYERIARELNG